MVRGIWGGEQLTTPRTGSGFSETSSPYWVGAGEELTSDALIHYKLRELQILFSNRTVHLILSSSSHPYVMNVLLYFMMSNFQLKKNKQNNGW